MGPAYNRREFKRGDVMHDMMIQNYWYELRMAKSGRELMNEAISMIPNPIPWPRRSVLVT